MLWKSVFSRIVNPLSCLPSRFQCSSISLYSDSISLNNTMKNVQKMQWGRVEPATSHPHPLIYLVIYEIYEKNFINIDQCAMIHEQGLHRSNVCRVEKQIKFNGIASHSFNTQMPWISFFNWKMKEKKRMKIQNKTILFV